MKNIETREIKIFSPYYTEESAKHSVEYAKKIFGKGFKETGLEWISSAPVYIPFWIVQMEMTLRDPRKGLVTKVYRAMVNGITGRGSMTAGTLSFQTVTAKGIIMDDDGHGQSKVNDEARLAVLGATQKLINPPPCRMLPGTELVYYPMALVHCKIKGKEDFRMFDYVRGGLDKWFLNYLRYKEIADAKKGVKPNPNPIPDIHAAIPAYLR
ncbi:MAG: hypothetical protein LBB83_11915 [Treponema sp.]|nr:hypothetical protein [Treponema sp.]